VILGLVTWFVVANIFGFLSLTERAEGARIIVVEGWVSDRALENNFKDFKPGEPYDYICTTGMELPVGHYLTEHKSYAQLTAKTLVAMGVPRDRIIIAETGAQPRDRTYYSAVGLKEKSAEIPALGNASAIDVLTQDVHGRRTRTVYRKVFGDGVKIGVIAEEPANYAASDWFKTSEGVKSVITESISLGFEWIGPKDR